MQRVIIPAAAALLIAAASLSPSSASAQSGRTDHTGGATATGNAWLNENSFDYNRQHWLPPSHQSNQSLASNPNEQRRYGTGY